MIKIIRLLRRILVKVPLYKKIYETRATNTPIIFRMWFIQKILGFNKAAYWPVHHSSIIGSSDKIYAGIDVSPGFMPGCYMQGMGGIVIGDYTQISCNVGIISQNHDVYDIRQHIHKHFPSVIIGKYCWIGMNSMILPGVKLGDFTVVGAGSVVTKSFPEGFCIIAGNPAKVIRKLNPDECVYYRNEHEYCGYIPKSEMTQFRERFLKI